MSARRRLLALSLLFCLLPQVLFAAPIDWDISQGDLRVTQTQQRYRVHQSTPGPSSHRIVVDDQVQTELVLDGLYLASMNKSLIQLGETSHVALHLQGLNRFQMTDKFSEQAVIAVHNATLSIQGDGQMHVEQTGKGAGIGSANAQAMPGTIHITGQSKVKILGSALSAAIGAGGEMSGQILIDGGAEVEARTRTWSHSVISQNNIVTQITNASAAGIGSGHHGDMTGEIRIGGDAQVTSTSNHGASLGASMNGALKGRLIIEGKSKVTAHSTGAPPKPDFGIPGGHDSSAALGSHDGAFSGRIVVQDEAQVEALSSSGPGLGSVNGEASGEIYLLDKAQITLQSNPAGQAFMGSGAHFRTDDPQGNYHMGEHVRINGVSAADPEALIEAKLVNIHLNEEGQPSNYQVVLPPPPPAPAKKLTAPAPATPVGLRHLHQGQLSVGPVELATTGLKEERITAFLPTGTKRVAYLGQISFLGEDPKAPFTLSFHLGAGFAGRSLVLWHRSHGELRSYQLQANASGLLSLPLSQLGSFMILIP